MPLFFFFFFFFFFIIIKPGVDLKFSQCYWSWQDTWKKTDIKAVETGWGSYENMETTEVCYKCLYPKILLL